MGAREYFGEVRRAAERIEELGRTISGVEDGELAVGRIGGRVPRASGVGDPTATEAEARRRFVVAARAERDAALEVVGEAQGRGDGAVLRRPHGVGPGSRRDRRREGHCDPLAGRDVRLARREPEGLRHGM